MEWAKNMGGQHYEYSRSIATDLKGNVYTTGMYYTSGDFDPGPGEFILKCKSSDGIFISKLNAAGKFVWAKTFERTFGVSGYGIATDRFGNVFITGNFNDTVDFDPGPAKFNMVTTGAQDMFVVKLDSSGNFVWAKQLGGKFTEYVFSTVLDKSGNIYTTGIFGDTADFDPGPGVHNIIAPSLYDIFISKLDSAGNFVWAKCLAGSKYYNKGLGVAVDDNGNVYATGIFYDTLDVDPGPATYNLISDTTGTSDCYILKLYEDGNFAWAKRFGSHSNEEGTAITTDNMGFVYTTGRFGQTVDFDPGIKTFNLTPKSWADMFILKLDGNGNFIWAKGIGKSNATISTSIVVDQYYNVYSSGYFYNTVDFDPGPGSFELTTTGNYQDAFIVKLDFLGNFIWASKFGSDSYDEGNAMAVDGKNNIYTTGRFSGTVDFESGGGKFSLESLGEEDIFVCKMSQDSCSNLTLVIDSLKNISCSNPLGFASAFTLHGLPPYKYLWNTQPPITDSVVKFNSKGIYSLTVKDSNGCHREASVLINGPTSQSGYDLNANIIAGTFRPGRSAELVIELINSGCKPVDGDFTLVLDENVSYASAFPAPDLISNNTLSWHFPHLAYGSSFKIIVQVNTATTVTIDDEICFELMLTPLMNDFSIFNNNKLYCYPVVNSHDPNLISVYPRGACQKKLVLKKEPLTYTIQFQNNGNAEAIDIYILDTIDSNLDIKTLNVIGKSHEPLITEVLPGRVIKFRFDNIYLPDSMNNEPLSHGHVIYEIMPDSSVKEGTLIKAKAGIYFDYNPPVITNTVESIIKYVILPCDTNKVYTTYSTIKIYPNPSANELKIELPIESGLAFYDMIGNLVYKNYLPAGQSSIVISHLAVGIYIVKVNDKIIRFIKSNE